MPVKKTKVNYAILNVNYIDNNTPYGSHKFYVNKIINSTDSIQRLMYPNNCIYFESKYINHKLINGREYELYIHAIINPNTKNVNIKTVIVKEVSAPIDTYIKKKVEAKKQVALKKEPEVIDIIDETEELYYPNVFEEESEEEPEEELEEKQEINSNFTIKCNNEIIKLTDGEILELKNYIRFIMIKRTLTQALNN